MTRGRRAILAVALLAAVAGCARNPPPLPAPATPAFAEYPFPDVSDDLKRSAGTAAGDHEQAWRAFQHGNLRDASRRFTWVLAQYPGFYPSEAGLGFVSLADREAADALERFDLALTRSPTYTPALVGRGEALLALGRDQEALASYRRALEVNPNLPGVRRRVEVIAFRGVEAEVTTAQKAHDAGDWQGAKAAYGRAIAASPSSGFLYRDLALVERKLGESAEALAHLEQALALDPNDAAAWVATGELRTERNELQPALDAYRRAASLDPSLPVTDPIAKLEARIAEAALPEQYRAIPAEPSLSRGSLAALLGVRLPQVVAAAPKASVLVTDTRRHWADPWIVGVAQARLMDVYDNHTFQPAAPVTRGGFAVAVSRVLGILEQRDAQLAARLAQARGAFTDLAPTHLLYPAASRAVASGILPAAAGEPFQPLQPVTGAEAMAAMDRLDALARQSGLGPHAHGPSR
jgi:tetratricopeptide (TPR) repeat protein